MSSEESYAPLADSDYKVQSTETEVIESLNIHGGRTVKASIFQKSGPVQILMSYTIIEYNEKGTAMSRNMFDSKGLPIPR
ncbi:hypothetical protein MPTK1_6g14080 [Marchantia polymorpha subsp. ruderalis]|uniref:Uncharacterized protein n=2 Tax=Marchantia polymorpha TaxID=3197 RepID=A0AAF6BRV5_MARPO|nr:hypothetical protein MARPO_0047s0062 [Marchantia polymorpha]BBN14737.1 hypothetical protein Mp_6g14080 [Marchantia polymorpha subsp. ruderalis]PTQ39081.1 hypothetical protein MARPO_0047s0062 [Marchantia polymorpha]PTQ39082.1 hypothetical protein MARPO_0047s0062 [Marchantia polymorpha]BBN14738.1 hypothetical protein Mp_6g14080 [Marchantia polymorpha subsp. ruderalis]|eukprot:PTQ39080.1 hypothetical protein MARPO_0047s0062 [Marchantia polymorpha]